jgi:hypothetical protein
VVTSLSAEQWAALDLYEKFYCARGEMENCIKEQMCLFAYRLSTVTAIEISPGNPVAMGRGGKVRTIGLEARNYSSSSP